MFMMGLSAVLAALLIATFIWIRFRERHWVGMIEAINQNWNNAYKASPEGYPHTHHLKDHRGLPSAIRERFSTALKATRLTNQRRAYC